MCTFTHPHPHTHSHSHSHTKIHSPTAFTEKLLLYEAAFPITCIPASQLAATTARSICLRRRRQGQGASCAGLCDFPRRHCCQQRRGAVQYSKAAGTQQLEDSSWKEGEDTGAWLTGSHTSLTASAVEVTIGSRRPSQDTFGSTEKTGSCRNQCSRCGGRGEEQEIAGCILQTDDTPPTLVSSHTCDPLLGF